MSSTRPPILITGACGFIGSHVTERFLAEDYPVVGVDNLCNFYSPDTKRRNIASAIAHDGFRLVEADITDAGAVQRIFDQHRPESVIHMAAMAGVQPSIERPELYAHVNVHGTACLLNTAVKYRVQKFIFASSSSVYGNSDKTCFSEDDAVDEPISPYAATKRAGELLCHAFSHLYDFPISCLRFFTVYGPRQRPDLAISKFLTMASTAEPIPIYGDGSSSRDYTYIDDVVQGVFAAWQRCRRFSTYNIGNSSPVTLQELIRVIEQTIGHKLAIDRRPFQAGDVVRTCADIRRATSELAYEPMTLLADGIARQWRWYQESVAAVNTPQQLVVEGVQKRWRGEQVAAV